MDKDKAKQLLPNANELHEMVQEAMEEDFGDPDAFNESMAKNVLDKLIDWITSDA